MHFNPFRSLSVLNTKRYKLIPSLNPLFVGSIISQDSRYIKTDTCHHYTLNFRLKKHASGCDERKEVPRVKITGTSLLGRKNFLRDSIHITTVSTQASA